MSATASVLPHRSVPVLNRNPSVRQGDTPDPSTYVMNLPWYLALQQILQGAVAGNAGGDLSGTYPNPIVVGLQGVVISATPPTTGQVLEFNGTQWIATTPSVTPGAATIDYHTISGALNIVASVLPAPTNGMLIVALTMAAGAVQPTWDAGSFSIAPGAISIVVGTKTNCLFCADGSGKWMLVAPPMTNR